MIIKNQKELGDLIFQRLNKNYITFKEKEAFAKTVGLKTRMLYMICRGSNTKFNTMLRILNALGITLNISRTQESKAKNGKKKITKK